MKNTKVRTTSVCRDLQHAWKQARGGHITKTTYFRILVCERDCGYERHQTLDRHGNVTKETTRYTDKTYLIKGGRLTADEKAAIRLMHLGD
jgi:hypothetical protein